MTIINIVSTRFMIISDTHEHEFDGTSMPSVDVLLHCGDLTHFGSQDGLKKQLKMMGSIKAELKLVIAGNHDLSLDKTWCQSSGEGPRKIQEEDYAKAIATMTGPLAKAAGVTYLEEGTYNFTLKNGAQFTMYASPYTPDFYAWGFPFYEQQDRFNDANQVAPGYTAIGGNPIPNGIDVVMTHGPPHMILDETDRGEHPGSEALLHALSRTRPLMTCFGHIHEGYGANLVTWAKDGTVLDPATATPQTTDQRNIYPATSSWPIQRGEQTLMVNAAIMVNKNHGMSPDNKPFIVALDLPMKKEQDI